MQMRCQRYGEARFYISAFAFDSLTTYGIESSFLSKLAKMALEVEESEKAKCLFLCIFMFFFYLLIMGWMLVYLPATGRMFHLFSSIRIIRS